MILHTASCHRVLRSDIVNEFYCMWWLSHGCSDWMCFMAECFNYKNVIEMMLW